MQPWTSCLTSLSLKLIIHNIRKTMLVPSLDVQPENFGGQVPSKGLSLSLTTSPSRNQNTVLLFNNFIRLLGEHLLDASRRQISIWRNSNQIKNVKHFFKAFIWLCLFLECSWQLPVIYQCSHLFTDPLQTSESSTACHSLVCIICFLRSIFCLIKTMTTFPPPFPHSSSF